MSVRHASWTHGYRADSEYTFGIYPFLNPDTLLLTLALQGIRPAADIVSSGDEAGRRLIYCELGSGQGMTLNWLAARDPGGSYYGVDYNPNQVRNARAFAEAAGIENVEFAEESFADLADYDIPDCDIISLHGIWSWIDPKMQDCIVQFTKRKLKPGGILFVSYNCAVGRSADHPMRRLMIATEKTSAQQDRTARLRETIQTSMKLANAGARYFTANPASAERLKGLLNHEPNYVEQEYLNGFWQNYFHDEVAAVMAEAKLNYAGSSSMANNRIEMALPPEARELADRLTSSEDRELLKDLWTNNTFRQDIYVRGVQQISTVELQKLLAPLSFSLARARTECKQEIQVPGGSAKIPDKPYMAILDALAKEPQTGEQIAAIIQKAGVQMTLDGAIGALIAIGHITLAPDKAATPNLMTSLAGFEKATDDLVTAGHNRFTGIVPGLGSSLQLSAIDYFFWSAHRKNIKKKPEWVLKQLTQSGRSVIQDGAVVTDKPKALKLIKTQETNFNKTLKPLLALGQNI